MDWQLRANYYVFNWYREYYSKEEHLLKAYLFLRGEYKEYNELICISPEDEAMLKGLITQAYKEIFPWFAGDET